MLYRYARILSHYPYVVLLVVLVVVATCLVVTLTVGHSIKFEEPLAGFEPRGTALADRLITFDNLVRNENNDANLLPFSSSLPGNDNDLHSHRSTRQAMLHQSAANDILRQKRDHGLPQRNFGQRIRNSSGNSTRVRRNLFCGIPDKGYSRIIVESSHHRSLFNVEDLKAICHLESSYFRSSNIYQNMCISNEARGDCCHAWSVGSYVAVLTGKTSCLDITAEDVSSVQQLLLSCAPFFHNLSIGPNCAKNEDEWYYSHQHPPSQCLGVPLNCKKYNAIYHILYFLSDSNFMHTDTSSSIPPSGQTISSKPEPFLKFSSIFLPVVAGSKAISIFQHLEKLPREFSSLTIVGAHFGVKFALFEQYLISDYVWLGLVCTFIFFALWLYTTSIFVTIMTFLSMFWAVEVAYFLYTFVFKIKFFPYMNMVTLFVMLGIGADDLFIYCKVWNLAKSEKNNGVLEKIVSDTLHHTVLSMFVTSLTTAAAFYANYVSDITAIRCFSVFAGTSVLINFVLTVTWIPASIMLHERWLRCCVGLSDRDISLCHGMCRVPYKIYYCICDWSRIFFEKILPCLVIKFRYVWIIVFGGLWICSIIVIFYYPRFKLPGVHKFQVFASDHLLERYDFEFGELFYFERVRDGDDVPVFPITVVWGVLATDNGDPLDPYNKGSLTYDPTFDLTSPDAQRWILDFCSRLRHSDFYLSFPGIQLTDCFLENFVHRWMKRPCDKENMECCNETLFPFPKSKMITCLSSYIPPLSNTPGVQYNNHSPGPRFSNGRISAFFVQFLSNYSFSHSYEDVHAFYMKVENWVREQLLEAPNEMKRGWFVSSLDFYDLQSSLAMGTPLALGISLLVVAIVSFFTTLNVLISLYALLAVGATISVTLASLVLMEWELGVLESVVITVAIGLAVDLTLHYGVAFRLSPDLGREMRVINSLGRMGSPVAMAAFTTMLAGAFMMPSTVLAYNKFGTFLLLLVCLAWLYSTFFFQSLLRTVGPHEGFGQFHWPASDCCLPSSREHVDKTIYALSESTLSSSSTSTREHSHGHYSYNRELEPLTDGENSLQQQYQHHHHSDRGNCDSDHNRHQQRPHYHHHHHHHHHHHRSRRKSDYTSVRTTVSSAETSPLRNLGSDLSLPASSTCIHNLTPTLHSVNNTLNVHPDNNTLSFPSDNNTQSSPSDNNTLSSPSDNNMLSFPSDNNTLSLPSDNNTLSFPSVNNMLSFPSDNNTLSFPSDNNTLSFPSDNITLNFPLDSDKLDVPLDSNKLNVSSDNISHQSSNDVSSECNYKMVDNDSDSIMSVCKQHGTTQAQIEVFPRSLPLQVP